MSRWTPAPIVGGAYKDDTRAFSVQDTVNWIPERAEHPGGRSEWMLRDAPGALAFAVIGSGPIRGLHDCEGLLLAVSGGTLYTVAPDGSAISRGTIPGVSRVSMAHNQITGGNEVLIANGQSGYVYNTATETLSQITDEAYPGATTVDYLAQVLPQIEPQRRYWFHSDVTQATQYLSTDQYEAESAPDLLVALIATHGQLVVFGDRTGEFYEATGGATSFFERMQGTTLEVGCASAHAVVRMDATVFWVGSDGCGYRLNGYNAQRITTHAIEQAWARCDLKKCFAFTFEDRGHKIVYFTFPDGGTWGYDVATLEWHRRQSEGLDRWRMNALVLSNGQWIGGDYRSGRLFRLDWLTKLEGCDRLERERVTGVLHDNENRVGVNGAKLVFDTGGPDSLPHDPPTFDGDLGDGYTGQVVDYQYATTGAGTVTLIAGALPDGLSLSAGGRITGPRGDVGEYAWTVQFADDCGNSITIQDFSNTWGLSVLDPEVDEVKYLVVDDADATDYSSPSFDDSAWATGLAPFGNINNSAAASVGFSLTPVTPYPLGKKLWYRSRIYLNSTAGVTADIFGDDSATAWINGVQFYTHTSAGGSGIGEWYTAGVTVPAANLVVGWNDIAFMSREIFGGQSYFDYRLAQAGYTPPTPASEPSIVTVTTADSPTDSREVRFRYSKDGANNWAGWVPRSLGEVGAFRHGVKYTRLGKGRQWVFHVKVTSPIAAHLLAASYKLEGADS